jgi:hypothetical protein
VVFVGVVSSGCAAGFDASTNKPYAPSNGSIAQIANLRIRNVVIVQSQDGGLSELYASITSIGGAADGYGTVAGLPVDAQPDTLTGIKVSGGGSVSIPGGTVTVAPGQRVDFGPTGTTLFVDGLTAKQGEIATVTFSFATAGSVAVDALVMSNTSLVNGG